MKLGVDLKKKWKIVLALVVMQFLTMGTVGIAPALAEIAKAFPDKTPEQIQLLMSIPSLATVISSLLAPVIAAKLTRKRTVILGEIIFLIFGILPMFVSDWNLIIASRFGIGFGCGFCNVLDTSLIFTYFDKGEEEHTMLGWQQTGNDIGYIIMALAAGYLTLISWQACFAVHLVGVLSLLATIIWLPNNDFEQKAVAEKEKLYAAENEANAKAMEGQTVHLTGAAIFWLAIVLIYEGTLHTFSMNIAFRVEEAGVGNAVLSGYASTLMTVGGFIISLFFGKVSQALKRYTLGISVCIAVVALGLCYVMSSPAMALVGGFLIGFGMVPVFSSLTSLAMNSVNQKTQNLVSALFLVCINGGQFLNPYWGSFLSNTFRDGSTQGKFICAAVVEAIIAVICLFAVDRIGAKFGASAEEAEA